jgi:hypothetical protein
LNPHFEVSWNRYLLGHAFGAMDDYLGKFKPKAQATVKLSVLRTGVSKKGLNFLQGKFKLKLCFT